MKKTFVYISSWAHPGPIGGLGVYEMDQSTGGLTLIQRVDLDARLNGTYIDKKRNVLYALDETDRLPTVRAGGGGRVFVYQMDPETGKLTVIGKKPTWCPNPSFITLDVTGQYAVVSNHSSRSAVTKIGQDAFGKYVLNVEYDDSVVELFEVEENGMLGELLDVKKHYGDGPGERQAIPHPHCAVMSPDGKLFAVCDKGNDTVTLYQIDRKERKLQSPEKVLECAAGSMPRYCVFHPTLPFFYHNNEGNLFLNAYRYDENGCLSAIGAYSTVPADFKPTKAVNEQQGLCIHPNGKYIYDIVRGPDVVSVFEVNAADGSLQLIQNQSVNSIWPRGCTISDDGRFLIVCGLTEGKFFVYEIGEDGKLKDNCREYEQPSAAYATVWMP